MSHVIARLWKEEAGVIISSELVVLSALLIIGMVVGLQTVREAVVLELGDFANAIGSINQSYSFAGITGHHSSTAGSVFADARDDCDLTTQTIGGTPNCITVCTIAATSESF